MDTSLVGVRYRLVRTFKLASIREMFRMPLNDLQHAAV